MGAWRWHLISEELSERLGLHTKATRRFYDVVVIGAACALYGSTEGLKTVLVGREWGLTTGGADGGGSVQRR